MGGGTFCGLWINKIVKQNNSTKHKSYVQCNLCKCGNFFFISSEVLKCMIISLHSIHTVIMSQISHLFLSASGWCKISGAKLVTNQPYECPTNFSSSSTGSSFCSWAQFTSLLSSPHIANNSASENLSCLAMTLITFFLWSPFIFICTALLPSSYHCLLLWHRNSQVLAHLK